MVRHSEPWERKAHLRFQSKAASLTTPHHHLTAGSRISKGQENTLVDRVSSVEGQVDIYSLRLRPGLSILELFTLQPLYLRFINEVDGTGESPRGPSELMSSYL